MANSRLCSIPGCDKPTKGRGWCAGHYHRWTRHGDPLGGGTGNGEPLRFLNEVVLPYRGDDCLFWPFAASDGYARIRADGGTRSVPNMVCEAVNGPAPPDKYEAAHSCGKGRLGCVTPGHLEWKTPKENQADKLLHGTHNRGERHGMAKITEANARDILQLKGKLSQTEIGKLFNVTRGTVKSIHNGENWSWLTTQE